MSSTKHEFKKKQRGKTSISGARIDPIEEELREVRSKFDEIFQGMNIGGLIKFEPSPNANNRAFITGLSRMKAIGDLWILMNCIVDVIHTKKYRITYRTNNNGNTGLKAPTFGKNGYLLFSIDVDPDNCSKDLYPYTSLAFNHFEAYYVSHPLTVILYHENDHFYDALLHEGDLLKGIKVRKKQQNTALLKNFQAYNKDFYSRRLEVFTNPFKDDIDKTHLDIKDLGTNPKDISDYYFNEFAHDMALHFGDKGQLNQSQIKYMEGLIWSMIRNKNIEDFEERINALGNSALIQKAKRLEQACAYFNSYSILCSSYNTTNYDDVKVILPKIYKWNNKSAVFHDGATLSAYIQHFPEDVSIFSAAEISANNFEKPDHPSPWQPYRQELLFPAGNIGIRLTHLSQRQFFIEFIDLLNDPKVSKVFKETLRNYTQMFLETTTKDMITVRKSYFKRYWAYIKCSIVGSSFYKKYLTNTP